ncbi:leucine-rich repeats and immunoglobulin-like domains protein 2 [Mytilus edulis]|uniref:leucine-rich repeats and immunoglobulin-like domains protein 2 n=1 Tax=Mytilus edulis TaxID=6550 RepID=UPI0039EF0F9A
MYVQFLLLLCVVSCIATTNQICSEYLSNSCFCVNENAANIRCNFNTTDALEILNSSVMIETVMNLTKLDISGNNLSALPTSFFNGIHTIRELDLSENNFKNLLTFLPLEIATNIKKLNVSSNHLTDIDDFTFSTLHLLEILDISYNELTEVKDNTFVNNRYLWCLNLSNNKLQSLSATTFNGLENSVRDLDISENNLSILHSETFMNLHDLKSLKLAYNQYTEKISNLLIPHHVVLLDLSYSGIQHINDCQLEGLIDLEYINLHGNPLTCSCHLSWLHQRLLHNQEMDSIHTIHSHQINDWTCKTLEGATINVTDLNVQCSGHYFLNPPEHCTKSKDPDTDIGEEKIIDKLKLKTEKEDDGVSITWRSYNNSNFYGYDITIFNEDGNKIYHSPTLHQSATKYSAQSSELRNGKYQVCLNVLQNETHSAGRVCNEISYLDLQIIVGILAGVIFLIPCIVALVYIICLDKKRFLLYDDYDELSVSTEEKEKDKKTAEKSEKTQSKQNTAKWSKIQKDSLKVPTIKVFDYTKSDDHTLPAVRSTDRILPDDNVSIEPDGDSGSSAGIRIDIPSDNEEPGVANEGYTEDAAGGYDIKL